ncbi:MAG: NmrA family NAD(P)-binding protein [Ignavibacteria bacterium]|nr:NmrA family NAD(P)-binding protein [Ignavibacteria bacterium]
MKILVICGTGTVGSQVVANLLKRNADVRVMTSSAEKVQTLPAGTEGVVGNLKDKASLVNVFKGIERAFLLTPVSQTETEEGLNAVQAAKSGGVKRIVYMSVHRLEDIPDAPHFAGKIPIEKAIKESGIPYTIIRPNSFYQNDYWLKDPIMQYGIYPQPIGNVGVHRVDVRDIAEGAVNALLNDGHAGKTYSLVGPDLITGESGAKIFGKYLGKEVVYAGDDLDKWAEQAKMMLPEWMVNDFRVMFKHFQTKGFMATPEHRAETEWILGRKPRSFETFVSEATTAWKQEAKAGVTATATS